MNSEQSRPSNDEVTADITANIFAPILVGFVPGVFVTSPMLRGTFTMPKTVEKLASISLPQRTIETTLDLRV